MREMIVGTALRQTTRWVPRIPHAFTNVGDGNLRQIDIDASPQFSTEWLEESGT
jgi:hypothetical protein